jgi:hypothetical protein
MMNDATTAALGEISEIHSTRPVYRHDGSDDHRRVPDCTGCVVSGHYCPVCGDSADPVATNTYACRTAEIVAGVLMADLLGDLPESIATIAAETDVDDLAGGRRG